MTRDEWISKFAESLGVEPPTTEMVDALLELAGTAAHATERTAAPLACYLVGVSGLDPARAAEVAAAVSSQP